MGQLSGTCNYKGMHTYSSTMKVGIVCATEAIHIGLIRSICFYCDIML